MRSAAEGTAGGSPRRGGPCATICLMPGTGVLLSKWYLDCVADDGTVFLGYWAVLRWKIARVRYASTTLFFPDGRVETRRRLASTAPPRRDGGSTRWSVASLGLSGCWTSTQEERELELFRSPEGEIRWRCVAPVARVALELPGGGMTGRGYVENLQMTLPPWRLPVRDLRWGRYHSDSGRDWVVWIDWKGDAPMTVALTSEGDVGSPRVTDDSVDLASKVVLRLAAPRTLRRGRLGATALEGMIRLRALVPGGLLETREAKWLSRGSIERAGRTASEGWAVHELVRFPRVPGGRVASRR